MNLVQGVKIINLLSDLQPKYVVTTNENCAVINVSGTNVNLESVDTRLDGYGMQPSGVSYLIDGTVAQDDGSVNILMSIPVAVNDSPERVVTQSDLQRYRSSRSKRGFSDRKRELVEELSNAIAQRNSRAIRYYDYKDSTIISEDSSKDPMTYGELKIQLNAEIARIASDIELIIV